MLSDYFSTIGVTCDATVFHNGLIVCQTSRQVKPVADHWPRPSTSRRKRASENFDSDPCRTMIALSDGIMNRR